MKSKWSESKRERRECNNQESKGGMGGKKWKYMVGADVKRV